MQTEWRERHGDAGLIDERGFLENPLEGAQEWPMNFGHPRYFPKPPVTIMSVQTGSADTSSSNDIIYPRVVTPEMLLFAYQRLGVADSPIYIPASTQTGRPKSEIPQNHIGSRR